MTKGQLIVKCLQLLNENNGEKIDSQIVSNIPEYSERTSVIVPSINRALYRLSELKKLPVKELTVTYKSNSLNVDELPTKYDTAEGYIIIDSGGSIITIQSNCIMGVSNVILEDRNYGISTNISYFIQGEIIKLPPLEYGQRYTLFYQPKVIEVSEDSLDTVEIPYPDYVLNCVPYFVKADVFEEDNPTLANLSRNIFESYASQIPSKNQSTMRGVIDVYNLY